MSGKPELRCAKRDCFHWDHAPAPKERNVIAHARKPWVTSSRRAEPRRGGIVAGQNSYAAPSGLASLCLATHGLRAWANTYRPFEPKILRLSGVLLNALRLRSRGARAQTSLLRGILLLRRLAHLRAWRDSGCPRPRSSCRPLLKLSRWCARLSVPGG